MTDASEETLVQGYIEGREDAYNAVSRWIRQIIDSPHWGLSHQRDDLFQEVHRRLFENLSDERFRGSSSLRTYVTQISKYTCIEFLRQKIRSSAVDLESVDLRDNRPGPEQTLASVEWTREASAALARLPTSCRELFELIFVEHLPYDQIAEKLGVAEGTVKSRTWRCREQLANLLKEKGIALSS